MSGARARAPSAPASSRDARWKRLAWFVGLWIAGVATVASIAYLIRWAILP